MSATTGFSILPARQLAASAAGAVAAVLAAACPATAPLQPGEPVVAPAPPTAHGRYRITIVNASLAARRPDGKPWHVHRSGGTLKLVAGVAGRFLGSAEIGAEAGNLIAGPDQDVAPRAYVELNVAGKSYRTHAEAATLSPAWNHELAVDLEGVALDGPVVLLVKDGLDDGVIGQAQLTVRELLAQAGHTIAGSASVPIISLAVAPMPPRRGEIVSVWVPADRTLDQLTTAGAERWLAVHVEAGDLVTVRAEGKSCVDARGSCYGPEGLLKGLPVAGSFDQVAWIGADYNYELFKTSPHASLIATVGGVPARIGRETSFSPHRAGDILLFVNDIDARNNSGGFQVELRINEDALSPTAEAVPSSSPSPQPTPAPVAPAPRP